MGEIEQIISIGIALTICIGLFIIGKAIMATMQDSMDKVNESISELSELEKTEEISQVEETEELIKDEKIETKKEPETTTQNEVKKDNESPMVEKEIYTETKANDTSLVNNNSESYFGSFVVAFLILGVVAAIVYYSFKKFKENDYLYKPNVYYLKDTLKFKKIKNISDIDCKYLTDACNKGNSYAIEMFNILEDYELIKDKIINDLDKIKVSENYCCGKSGTLKINKKEYNASLILYLLADKNLNIEILLADLDKLDNLDRNKYINNLAKLYGDKISKELLFIKNSTAGQTLEDAVLEFNNIYETDIPINFADIVDFITSNQTYYENVKVNEKIFEETTDYTNFKYM